MSKRFKKFIAIVSAIALVVTSMTVYNDTAKAADYSGLNYTYLTSGTSKVGFFYESNGIVGMVSPVLELEGALLSFMFAGQEDGSVKVLVNDEEVQVGGAVIEIANSVVRFNPTLFEDDYTKIEINGTFKGTAGKTVAIISTATSEEEQTTTEASGEQPSEPAEDVDYSGLTYTQVGTTQYFVAAEDDRFPFQEIVDLGDKVKIIPQVNAGTKPIWPNFEKATVNGKAFDQPAGAGIEIPYNLLTEEYNVYQATGAGQSGTFKIIIKFDENVEVPTEAPYVDGEALVDEANVTKEVGAITGGNLWQAEYNNTPVKYVEGKKYVAEVIVSSNVNKSIKLVFQRVNIWDFVDNADQAAAGYEYTIEAGSKVKITYVFEVPTGMGTSNGNFDIYLGSVADAATLVFESKKLTTYNEVPAGVATGVEVLSATPEVTKYDVSVDGIVVAEVEEGAEYILGDAVNGYVCGDEAYKAGSTVTVNSDMVFTSIGDVTVTAEKGAGIRYQGTAGIRFQAKVNAKDDVLNSAAVKTGMIITANDIYEAHGSELDLDVIGDNYAALNIPNNGWYNDVVGTYCGSIVDIADSNYIRNFIAKAYVTITYTDGTTETVYSNMTGARSIKDVAQLVKEAGYVGIEEAYHEVIDAYAAAK